MSAINPSNIWSFGSVLLNEPRVLDLKLDLGYGEESGQNIALIKIICHDISFLYYLLIAI